jgi:hypothetical protein
MKQRLEPAWDHDVWEATPPSIPPHSPQIVRQLLKLWVKRQTPGGVSLLEREGIHRGDFQGHGRRWLAGSAA